MPTMTFLEDVYLAMGVIIVFAMIIIILGTFMLQVKTRLNKIERKLDSIIDSNSTDYSPCQKPDKER